MVCPPTTARSLAVAPVGLMKMPITLEPKPAAMAAEDSESTNNRIPAIATVASAAWKKYRRNLSRNLGSSR